jgi:hypothetical protein
MGPTAEIFSPLPHASSCLAVLGPRRRHGKGSRRTNLWTKVEEDPNVDPTRQWREGRGKYVRSHELEMKKEETKSQNDEKVKKYRSKNFACIGSYFERLANWGLYEVRLTKIGLNFEIPDLPEWGRALSEGR